MAQFRTVAFRSKLASVKNSLRIENNIITQPGREIIPYYVNINLLENSDKIDIDKCGICCDISLYSIVFLCSQFVDIFMSVISNYITMKNSTHISLNARTVRSTSNIQMPSFFIKKLGLAPSRIHLSFIKMLRFLAVILDVMK
jgi:hypothetical protein